MASSYQQRTESVQIHLRQWLLVEFVYEPQPALPNSLLRRTQAKPTCRRLALVAVRERGYDPRFETQAIRLIVDAKHDKREVTLKIFGNFAFHRPTLFGIPLNPMAL